jgi:hypothetical protein
MTLGITTLGLTTLSITILSITTLGINESENGTASITTTSIESKYDSAFYYLLLCLVLFG